MSTRCSIVCEPGLHIYFDWNDEKLHMNAGDYNNLITLAKLEEIKAEITKGIKEYGKYLQDESKNENISG